MNKSRVVPVLKITITFLVLVFSIYFSIWKVDFAELGRSFQTANYGIALLLVPLVLLSFLIRSWRWKVICRSTYPDIKVRDLLAGTVVGYFMNNVIPRSGEFARPWITSQRDKNAPFPGLLGTIVVERFLDVMATLVMVVTVLALDDKLFVGFEEFGITKDVVLRTLYPMLAAGVVVLFIAPTRFGFRIAEWCTKPLPERFRGKVLGALQQLLLGFGSIKTASQWLGVLLHTVLLNLVYIIPMYLMFFAFPAEAAISATFFDGVKILVLTSIAFAIAPTPGAFGVFHITARISIMKLLNFSYADAVAYATITHFASYATTMIVGGYYLVAGNVKFKEIMKRDEEV
jgi:uncharacterized protein (TIRG00374 family)